MEEAGCFCNFKGYNFVILDFGRSNHFHLKNFNFKPIFKWIFYGILIIGLPIYFGLAMNYNNPFYFIGKTNSTENVLDKYIFSNNKGKKPKEHRKFS